MKKNLSFIIICILIILVCLLLVFLVVNKVNYNKTKQYLSTNTGSKVMKVESSKEVTYIVEDYDKKMTYSWTFDKTEEFNKSLKENMKLDVDLRLNILTSSFDSEIDSKVSNTDKLVVSFNHHGELPSKATIRIQVGDKFENGTSLYLYYYNPEKDRVEYQDKNLMVRDGYVEFDITHCSDYLLTASIVQEAVNNPKNINIIIIVMVVVVIILIGTTLYQSKK